MQQVSLTGPEVAAIISGAFILSQGVVALARTVVVKMWPTFRNTCGASNGYIKDLIDQTHQHHDKEEKNHEAQTAALTVIASTLGRIEEEQSEVNEKLTQHLANGHEAHELIKRDIQELVDAKRKKGD